MVTDIEVQGDTLKVKLEKRINRIRCNPTIRVYKFTLDPEHEVIAMSLDIMGKLNRLIIFQVYN